MFRIAFTVIVAVFAALAPAAAQPLRFIIGLPAGGAIDGYARVIADPVAQAMGKSAVIENRPSASGNLAALFVHQAPADGHTIWVGTMANTEINPHIFDNLRWSMKDFLPIVKGVQAPLVLVTHPSVPAKTLNELVAWLKANPGKHAYASYSAGTPSHFLGAQFNEKFGLDLAHVPFPGSAPQTVATGALATIVDLIEATSQRFNRHVVSYDLEQQVGLLSQVAISLGINAPPNWLLWQPWNNFLLMVIMIWIQTGFALVVLSAAIKLRLLFLGTLAICFPGFFVVQVLVVFGQVQRAAVLPREVHVDRHRLPEKEVPVLQDGPHKLWESDLIVDYLLRTYPEAAARSADVPKLAPWLARPDRHWHDMTVLATIATCASSIVNLRLMASDGITPDNSDYLARQRVRVERCLDWLDGEASEEGFAPGWFSIMDIAFICPMAFADALRIACLATGSKDLDALRGAALL